MTRFLGVDLGDRRIGLAIAELDGGAAEPHTTIRRAASVAADVATLETVVAAERIDELVVGLPLDMSGTEGAQATATREWADAVGTGLGLPVRFRDERLSSHRAELRVGPMKRGRSGGPPTPVERERHRARVDREAAAIILQDELDALRDGRSG